MLLGMEKIKLMFFFDKVHENSTKLGFINGCRDGESLSMIASWDKITIEWVYPSASCISKQKKDKF